MRKELEERGIGRSPEQMLEEVGEMVAESLRLVPVARIPADPHAEFSPEQLDALSQGGIDLRKDEGSDFGGEDALEKTVERHAALMTSAFTEEEAARRLRRSRARVRQRIGSGSLYAIRTAEGRRLARFQFTEAGEVPHAGEVMRRVPADAHPVSVERWFTEPDPDLVLEESGQALSPRDWLLSGGSPQPLIRLAEEL